MEKAPLPTDENGTSMTDEQSEVQLLEVNGDVSPGGGGAADLSRDAWSSKVQYLLAQVGFSVGLGNVWRFPYLCHQNGGGAFLLLYVLLLVVVGIPLFFLELAAGQCIRQGSIGVWKHISPKLAGIGYSSCVVCFFVALYYNVIIGWSLFYLGSSFQYPLPWQQCPQLSNNKTVKECEDSSPTTYFWFRKALDITDSIDETGEFNKLMIACLLAAWAIVCLAMIKGIKSSGKVMYFSSLFPYVVLLCFLIRGMLLDGASEGITYMFYPKLSIWGEVQVWRQAATQVFFALGLGFGSIIAYSSYNPPTNNCHRDALMVSFINFFTSVLASLVVFAVLGFRAKTIAMDCVSRNLVLLSSTNVMAPFNVSDPSSVSLQEYRQWFQHHGSKITEKNITDCSLEAEMNKGVQGTGLAFIAFTEAMSLFPASPFWSTLFFLMLLNLGLSTMFGTMQGILTPLIDNFKTLSRHKTLLTVCSCAVGFVIGLVFTQRCGNYFVTMFDDYSATLPLIIVVIFETFSVSWVYGADRFLDDIKTMLQWRPPVLYKYLWQYVCLLAMIGLLGSSLLRMFFKRPTYTAWNQSTASEMNLEYPDWALAVLSVLIVIATLPVPIGYIHSLLKTRMGRGLERGNEQDVEREQYTKCNSDDPEFTPALTPLEEDDGEDGTCSNSVLPLGADNYQPLPQEAEDGEDTTGV
ncbi:sodium-dependent neutral amino acid transporter B(0)AT2-like [Megalops cyprinoides]|uniref:sodium-dependent neutral amino acid transporter B(0)AT2-like n=1 Tax=Megalops cyprinoides TaxID=118141 RepID=UPI001863FE40|nr:sodium-dependent neutral amino acid transporter B(0)AT2-like [Megalops cyprinoides]XP_036382515.1 sodium-dependent neutral amino acid transporter B(0)AT2-like [Megalops cyprinoides]XP_036382524.1 sodium-dependent neutral amino acid transporter B(0)AT2-like [Megalops cyprinoides]